MAESTLAPELIIDQTPSSSSSSVSSASSFPDMLENEVELTIPHFWRVTKPRQCMRSEIRVFQGIQFRLLVWPQGSKPTNPNYLSAFVEVIPSVASEWPADWLIPSVSYRISIMNHRQKWIYAKADTWSFSYVCPDRGWHSLLDTRYVNRRDGYLSPDGSLTVRASVLPRFSVPISVLPHSSLLSHSGGGLGQEHIISLVTLLHAIPGFKRFLLSLNETKTASASIAEAETEVDVLVEMERELDSVCHDLRTLMENVTPPHKHTCQGAAPVSASASASSSLTVRVYRHSGGEVARESLRSRHQKSLAVCDQLAEVIDELSRPPHVAASQTTTVQNRGALGRIRDRLQFGGVFRSLFGGERAETSQSRVQTVTQGLQRAVGLLDVVKTENRWKLLEKVSMEISRCLRFVGGDIFTRPATPEQVFGLILRAVRSEIADEQDRKSLDDFFLGSLAPSGAFEQVTLNNARSTNVEKLLNTGKQFLDERNLVLSTSTAEPGPPSTTGTAGTETDNGAAKTQPQPNSATERKYALEKMPRIVVMTVGNKVKDRLDVNEHLEMGGAKFRLHGFMVGHGGNGSDSSYAGNFQHYSVIMRKGGKKAPWTRIEENEISMHETHKLAICSTAASAIGGAATNGNPIAWVFSPEFPVALMVWVKESDEELLFERGVDVRHVNKDLIPPEFWRPSPDLVLPASPIVPTAAVPAVPATAGGQITVTFVTEKDLLAPQGYFSVFRNALSLTLGGGADASGKRKLLVRKDITVARLCDAVEQFFKIPASLVRLYALHYFADVQQERFEVMADSRSVSSYLSQHPVPGNFATTAPSLVVLVSRRPEIPSSITLWIKYVDAQSLALVSGGLLTVDVAQTFASYFSFIEKKFPSVKSGAGETATASLAVFEEFGPRLVERKREKIPIADENLTDGDVVIFADLAGIARPKAAVSVGPKAASSASFPTSSAVSWVEQLLPLFLKRKKQEISDRRARFLDNLLKQGDPNGGLSDSEQDEDEAEDQTDSKKPKISEEDISDVESLLLGDDASETSEAEISRQHLLQYLREAHRHLKLEISDSPKLPTSSPICFLCGISRESTAAVVSLVCSEQCVKDKISVHLLCLADLMGDGRPLTCVLTPGCSGRLDSGELRPKSDDDRPPPVPDHRPPTQQISDSLRARFFAACPPPAAPLLGKRTSAVPRGFVVPPLPDVGVDASAATGGSGRRRGKKGEATQCEKLLWWEACTVAVWHGDPEIANEFILAAEVAGTQTVDDLAALIFFTWKSQLLPASLPAAVPPPAPVPTPAAPSGKTARKKKKERLVSGQLSTATSTPVSTTVQLAVQPPPGPGEGTASDWQPVQRQKAKKKGADEKPARDCVKEVSTATRGDAEMEILGRIKNGEWQAEDQTVAEFTLDERQSLLAEQLRQFCLPSALVFVFRQAGRTLTALAPKVADGDEQIEAILGAAALCDAKVERAFAAPGRDARVRWFVELDSEGEATKIIKYMQQNLKHWDSPEIGILLDVTSTAATVA